MPPLNFSTFSSDSLADSDSPHVLICSHCSTSSSSRARSGFSPVPCAKNSGLRLSPRSSLAGVTPRQSSSSTSNVLMLRQPYHAAANAPEGTPPSTSNTCSPATVEPMAGPEAAPAAAAPPADPSAAANSPSTALSAPVAAPDAAAPPTPACMACAVAFASASCPVFMPGVSVGDSVGAGEGEKVGEACGEETVEGKMSSRRGGTRPRGGGDEG